MSPLDWLQIVAGFRYCLRRVILAVASLVACRAVQLASADDPD